MLKYFCEQSKFKNTLVLFSVIPIVILINLTLHTFIGGLLIIAALISALFLSKIAYFIYILSNIGLFGFFAHYNHMPPKAVILQGSVFIITLILAAIAGYEIRSFINQLYKRREENCKLTKELIYSFVTAIDAKDHYLKNHSKNVCYYAKKIASELGYRPIDVEIIALAALFHDIGKLNVDEHILNKPDKLDSIEWEQMMKHSILGVDMLRTVSKLDIILDFIKYHHRHYNGSGYPMDCDNEKVPQQSRILSVADAFDAMTSNRPYRKALDLETAYQELNKFSGTQFDPVVVDAFFRCKIKPVNIDEVDINLMIIFDHE